MRVRLPQMIQDPDLVARDVDRLVEDWTQLDEDHFLDGPITPRVAVVDLDPSTELLKRVDLMSTRDLNPGVLALEIPFPSDGPPP